MKNLADFRFNGKEALIYCIRDSEYKTIAQAVASLTVFTHPEAVQETRGRNVFKVIRSMAKRGQYGEISGVRFLYDDNLAPTETFLWANGIKRGEYKDVSFCHILAQSDSIEKYTSLANICMMPSFLAKLSDTDANVISLLSYRAHVLYGSYIDAIEKVTKPDSYDNVTWAEPRPYVGKLEPVFLKAMQTKPRNRATKSARELGWFFSEYEPDGRL